MRKKHNIFVTFYYKYEKEIFVFVPMFLNPLLISISSLFSGLSIENFYVDVTGCFITYFVHIRLALA